MLEGWVGGPGWRAARLAYTIAKRSKPAARAEREGSLRRLCAARFSSLFCGIWFGNIFGVETG